MELGGTSAGIGLRLASGAVQPLIKRLFGQGGGPGAGLVDTPVRVLNPASGANLHALPCHVEVNAGPPPRY
ncbi:hypothetical protein [Streptomyces sp. 6N223]|uniref:hypothetical protein n=1 Tax=Streptomyces sp. 6N223 TaxID=3457412 RepID=UPI003FD5724A